MTIPHDLLKNALALEAASRAELVDELLASLEPSIQAVDAAWADEAEDRVEGYERGEIDSKSVHEVMARYKPK